MSTPEIIGSRVSIVVICFNQAHYLSEAIQSISAQTFPNIDAILIDDGSTDETGKVASTYPWLKYRYQSHQGISAARNHGLRLADGEFVVFLDADDRFLPDALAAGLRCFAKNPESGFVFGRYWNINDRGTVTSAANQPSRQQDDFYREFLKRNLIGMQSTVMYRKTVLDEVGGFQARFRACEDYELYLRIARQYPVRAHTDLIAEYRRHGQNMSQDYRFMLAAVKKVLREQEPYASQNRHHFHALKTGFANWRNHYGSLMLKQFRTDLRSQGFNHHTIRRFGSLASVYAKGIGPMTKDVFRSFIRPPVNDR